MTKGKEKKVMSSGEKASSSKQNQTNNTAQNNQDAEWKKHVEEALRLQTAFFEGLAHTTIDGILVVDEMGKSIFFNKNFVRMWNIPYEVADRRHDEQMLDHVLPQLKHPDDFINKVKYLYAHPDEKSRDELEFNDGRFFDRYSSPLIDSDGRYRGRIWFFRDITNLKSAEKALTLFRHAIDSSINGCVISDARQPDYPIIYVNKAFERMTGYSLHEVMGKNCRFLQGKECNQPVIAEVRKALVEGRTFRGVVKNFRKNGTPFWNELSLFPLKADDGTILYYIGDQKDVTGRIEVETRLAEKSAEVEKSRSDLLSILNELELGTAMTDESGHVTFLSNAASMMIGTSAEDVKGVRWDQMLSLSNEEREFLKRAVKSEASKRKPCLIKIAGDDKPTRWITIEVMDDPRDIRKKIFSFRDTSDLQNLRGVLEKRSETFGISGRSSSIAKLRDLIGAVARVDSTVLIVGDTGVGKELVARAIHDESSRAKGPFIPVNCAGFTESLLASQLFGYRRGAFTGAVEDYEGVFEAANKGTIFLDEIGDMPIGLQTMLLRVLQEREVTRVGETTPRKIDVRLIVATNRNLDEEVKKGTFRQDLLYRIRVARIEVPLLKDRREDIPLLIDSLLAEIRAVIGKDVRFVTPEALRLMVAYSWPGNVRELKSALEYAVIRSKGEKIAIEDLPPELTSKEGGAFTIAISKLEKDAEWERIQEALRRTNGNRNKAAQILGMSRATLFRRLANHRQR